MPIGYVEQSLGYDRQGEITFSLWRIQDGLFIRHAAVVFTKVSEKAVVRWSRDDRKALRDA